ncbi:hypothetical protein CNY89_28165, partial [Amaricoccus sp. HAR-UPW-R2A-40]
FSSRVSSTALGLGFAAAMACTLGGGGGKVISPSRSFLAEIGRHRALVAVTVFQAVCALLFLADVLSELPELRTDPAHPLVELAAVAAL